MLWKERESEGVVGTPSHSRLAVGGHVIVFWQYHHMIPYLSLKFSYFIFFLSHGSLLDVLGNL